MSERDADDDRPRKRRRFEEDEDERPRRRPASSGGMGIGVILAIVFGGLFLVCAGGVVAAYLLLQPAVVKVREAAERMNSSNNLKRIGIALHNYHETHGRLPPPYFKTKDGKPGLSWRVALLPFMEQEQLYRQFKLDEPWDSAGNRGPLYNMPVDFRGDPKNTTTSTPYLAFVGKNAMFEPEGRVGWANVTDGTANTIMVFHGPNEVAWTQPDDFAFDMSKPLPPLGAPGQANVLVLFADGSVKSLKQSLPEPTWKNLINRQDGNVVSID